ncbi:Abi family protein [Corynebacterium urogenitale]
MYEADRKLRTLVHDGIERIEIALRARITNHLCLTDDLGPLVYEDPSHFRSKFDHLDWMRTVYSPLSRAKSRSEPIKHYQSNYAGKFLLWVVADTLDFVDISKLYAGMSSDDQRSVAEGLNLRIDFQQLSRNQLEH